MGEEKMNEKNINEGCNPSGKELAIYLAVIDLINEGADVSSMKVGDITAKAGIGKGTAYEYFQSKEEMVEKALGFYIMNQIMTVRVNVSGKEKFRDKFMSILDYMEENRDQIRPFLWIMRLKSQSVDISTLDTSSSSNSDMLTTISFLVPLANWFLSFADAEGLISEKTEDFRISALLSQIVQFAFYLHLGGERDMDNLKEFIYQGFLKQLN